MTANYKSNEPSTDVSGDRETLDRIDEGVKNYYQSNTANIERFRSEREFLFITQWMSSEIAGFQQLNKPIFTYNKLYDYYKKLIGEQRYNTSSLEVRSKNLNNENISQEEVTLRADIIRGIEDRSRAYLAYQNAFGNAVSGGMGFFRLRTDYVSPKSFLQEIYIEKEPYADRVFYDPSAISITKTDGNYMGRYDTMSRKDFEDKYPDVPYPRSFPASFNLEFFTWGDKDQITICEYYEKKWFSFTLYQLSNGECVSKKEYNKRKKEYDEKMGGLMSPMSDEAPEENSYQEALDAQNSTAQQPPDMQQPHPGQMPSQSGQTPDAQSVQMPPPVDQMPGSPQSQPMPQQPPQPMQPPMMAGVEPFPEIESKRKSRDYKIICYKAVFGKILETYEWPGKEFPLIAVMGGEEYVKGRPVTTSLTTYARDPQRFFNFLVSDLAQAAKNNRREQFLVTPDNIAGFENFWSQPGNVLGGLLYNPDGITKEKPERLPPADLPQSLLANLQQADRDMRSIIGYPQDNSDSRSFGQLTGKAIREMQRVGNSANLIFFDNLKAAQEQMGKAILSMIPIVYDTERTLSVHSIDGKARDVVVNKKIAGKISNDLSKGDFDVTVTAGANYAVQKEEALQALLQVIQVIPGSGERIADLLGESIDIEKNVELVKRLKTLVPPQVLAQAEGRPAPPPQPDPQQQMEQQLAQAKLQIEAAKVQGEQEKVQAQRELNKVKMTQALTEEQSSKIRMYGELQKAGLNYKAQMVQAAAKVASSHADIADKHFEAVKHIHNLTQEPLREREEHEE